MSNYKTMKRILSLISILALIVIISCENEESKNYFCNVSNPAEELPWLKTMILDLSDYSYIMAADYKGKTVFYNVNCNPLVNYASTVFNCNGDLIGNTNDIRNELSNVKLIWKHADSKCDFSD